MVIAKQQIFKKNCCKNVAKLAETAKKQGISFGEMPC
jgi:hypothetical protein